MQRAKGFVDWVKVGDSIYPTELWNTSTRNEDRQLPDECEILEISKGRGSCSGVVFRVKNCGGEDVDLDSGWFTGMVPRESGEESE